MLPGLSQHDLSGGARDRGKASKARGARLDRISAASEHRTEPVLRFGPGITARRSEKLEFRGLVRDVNIASDSDTVGAWWRLWGLRRPARAIPIAISDCAARHHFA
jgi:hypothetical protein